MRTRITTTAVLLTVLLAACDASNDKAPADSTDAKVKASEPARDVDCSDTPLSQADWMEHCSEEEGAGTGGDGGPSTGLAFGDTYEWPDGLTVTVVEAKEVTDFGEYEEPEDGNTAFRVRLKLTNTGEAPADLGDLSTIIDGATNGGEAGSTEFSRGSAPLSGRLAPGVTVVKTDDNVLETKYGKRVVVTVQRASEDFSLEFPEFDGSIS
ncbi:hypothetical protein [Streptomyces sp. 4R-3d]|uniref:hypothetical protein n=1 Tax=Streptomyces sp. 4R-3d TaxID=2559605 RepID=UPI0010725757|nr:hypothetical protein [Streptomyces sp. 4R-3d]TFI30181.1 hypothetical protein E4P36_05395 [Streptomyces sp. 4R-3d]